MITGPARIVVGCVPNAPKPYCASGSSPACHFEQAMARQSLSFFTAFSHHQNEKVNKARPTAGVKKASQMYNKW